VGDTHSRESFVGYLAGSLGREAADGIVVKTCRELKLDPTRFTVESALQVCELIAQEPGLVGIAGRFAKMKLILAWGAPKKA